MNYKLILLCLLAPVFLFAQNNTKNNVAAEGYDVVAYFSNTAVAGKSKFKTTHEGIVYTFSSAENKETFIDNPEQYLPEYGGWCAYAMAVKGEKVEINPKTYEIRDGKLYLFYNKYFTNTLTSWLEENPEKLIPAANEKWAKLKQ